MTDLDLLLTVITEHPWEFDFIDGIDVVALAHKIKGENMSTQPRRGGFSGSTKNTLDSSAMLGSEFWKEGMQVSVLYNREFATKYGAGTEFLLVVPRELFVKVDEFQHYSPALADDPNARKITRFAMPPLAGFEMAVQDLKANGFDGFRLHDACIIKCVGIQKSTQRDFSDMPLFEISVDPR